MSSAVPPGGAGPGLDDPRGTVEAQAARLAASGLDTPGPYLIGVRHHAPSLSAVVPALLDAAAPEVLLVELPAEFQPWLGLLADEATTAPVALAAAPAADRSNEDADGIGAEAGHGTGLAFYPFADFSPELAALRWARRHGVETIACDLPLAVRDRYREREHHHPDGEARPGVADALRHRLTGRDDDEDLWDRLVETAAPGSTPEAVRRAALLVGWAMRQDAEDGRGVDPYDLRREAWMRERIREAGAGGRRVAAVIGAFHAPAFTGDGPAAPAEHPAEAAPDARHVVSLIPYTYPLLDARSGYPAGIRDPEWQHTVLDAGGDPDRLAEALVRTAVRICEALRSQDHPSGPADAREIVRLAGDLSRLRGLAAPGRGELVEAVQTVLAQGEPLGRGRAVARALEKVLIGTRTGEPTPAAPRSGLAPAVERLLAELGLPGPGDTAESAPRELRLDPLRSPLDRRRELLLHRLGACGVPYAESVETTGAGGTETLTTRWRVRWTPAVAAMLTVAGTRGVTPAQAAEGVLRERLRREQQADGPTAREVLRGLADAAACGLPALTGTRLTQLTAVLPASGTLPDLLDALALLDRLTATHHSTHPDTPTRTALPTGTGAATSSAVPQVRAGLSAGSGAGDTSAALQVGTDPLAGSIPSSGGASSAVPHVRTAPSAGSGAASAASSGGVPPGEVAASSGGGAAGMAGEGFPDGAGGPSAQPGPDEDPALAVLAAAAEVVTVAAVRQLEGLGGSDEADDARALVELARRADLSGGVRLRHTLTELADGGSPLVRGAAGAVRVLLRQEDPAVFGDRTASWVDGATGPEARHALGRSLVGLLTAAEGLFSTAPEVLEPVLERVVGLPDTAFLDRLPALRGGFDTLSPAARDRLLHLVEERLGTRLDTLPAELPPALLADWSRADLAARAALARRGLLPAPLPAPTTDAPTTDAPTTDAPTTDAPTTDAPTTDAPTTDAPAHTHEHTGTHALGPAERWRLLLGRPGSGGLGGRASRLAIALDELYGTGHGEGSGPGLDGRGGAGGNRGGREAPYPGVREWSEELEALFGPGLREEVLAAAVAQGRGDVLEAVDPDAVRPSVDLLRAVLEHAGGLPEARLAALRPLVRRLVDELSRELATRLRPALTGISVPRPSRRPGGGLDLHRTIRANLATARPVDGDPGAMTIVPERPVFRTRARQASDWRMILVVDVSGSMEASTIWAALTASILAGVPSLSTHFVAFSTEVVDLTDRVTDPLGLLLEVQVGGGTDIAGGLRYARSLVTVPSRTLIAVVSDFEEGGPVGGLLAQTRALVGSGCHLLGCAALDDTGNARYSKAVAGQLVAAGMPVAALSPQELARWVGEKVR
ncbi:DUF5682 family protein [Kitasatospora sp. NPDC059463]|uniref:vWA domain-containing protein n=1 Tax=unclassified Kitasatospora TaxID=2633591 RepID=UPI0036740032